MGLGCSADRFCWTAAEEVWYDVSVCVWCNRRCARFRHGGSGTTYAQRRDGNLLPQDQSGQVTAVGCLVQGTAVHGGQKGKYVLARVRKGPATSVPEGSCTTDAGADALMVDNTKKAKITDAMVGRFRWRSAADWRTKPARIPTTFGNLT